MKIFNSFCVIGLLCLAHGCGNPYFGEFSRKRPAQKELVGQWKISPSKSHVPFSLSGFVNSATLSISGDGTFSASSLPGTAFSGSSSALSVSGDGDWKIKKHQSWWAIELDWLNRTDTNIEQFEDIYIRQEDGEYLLHYTVGDPDLGDAIVFRLSQKIGAQSDSR